MKKLIYTHVFVFGFFHFGLAQVGIGTDSGIGVVHIDAATNNSTAPDNTRHHDDVIITADGKLGVGTIQPITKLDMRNATNENVLAIGETSQTATQAGNGAVRYFNDGTNSGLHYSNGTNWIPINSKPINALVQANKNTSQPIPTNAPTTISNWIVSIDETNSFNPETGIFTAPRNGVYMVSLNLATESGSITNNSRIEVIIASNSTNGVPEFRCVNSYPGYTTGTATNIASGSCTGIFYLNQNQTITPRFYQNISTSNRNIIADNGYNSITITGL